MPWVGLQCVIVIFPNPNHTHLLLEAMAMTKQNAFQTDDMEIHVRYDYVLNMKWAESILFRL